MTEYQSTRIPGDYLQVERRIERCGEVDIPMVYLKIHNEGQIVDFLLPEHEFVKVLLRESIWTDG